MYTPVPMKRNAKYGSNYWESYSTKLKRDVTHYSDLEHDHWILVETNPKVINFCEQPVRINRYRDGRKEESVIDMWIQYRDKTEVFVEIKYTYELDGKNPKSERVFRQLDIQRSWCKDNRYNHMVQTEVDIRGNRIYLENMRYILPYQNNDITYELDTQRIKEIVRKGKTTLKDIERELHRIPIYRIKDALFKMFYTGELSANLGVVPISDKLEVWIENEY